jgi:hypothetical protein
MNKLYLLLILCLLLPITVAADESVTFTVKDRFILINDGGWFTFVETTTGELYYEYDRAGIFGSQCPDAVVENYIKFAPNTTHTVTLKGKYEIR